jgi:predicted Abi (CAAX) family protease
LHLAEVFLTSIVRNLRLRFYVATWLVRHRLVKAATTRPRPQDWIWAGTLLGVYTLFVIPLGITSHLFLPDLSALTWADNLRIAGRALLFPAIVEEGFWRVLLLPHKSEPMSDRKRWLIGLPILAMFVLMHPLNALTFYSQAFTTFTDPIFLIATTALGLICTIAYWKSGSWWVPATIHWLVVVVWLIYLGGYGRLHTWPTG